MSTPSLEAIYKLSDFSSLFEVAIALNLVFAVWDGLRNQATNKFKKVSSELNQAIQVMLGVETYPNSRIAAKFAEKEKKLLRELELLSNIAKFFGVLITVFLLGLLTFLGFKPDTMVNSLTAGAIAFTITCVSPLFLVYGNYRVHKGKNSLHEFKQHQTNALDDIKASVQVPSSSS